MTKNIIEAYCPICNRAITLADVQKGIALKIPSGYVCKKHGGIILTGYCTKKTCPHCAKIGKKSYLMENLAGTTWCTDNECNYRRKV